MVADKISFPTSTAPSKPNRERASGVFVSPACSCRYCETRDEARRRKGEREREKQAKEKGERERDSIQYGVQNTNNDNDSKDSKTMPHIDTPVQEFKYVVLGSSSSGKTSLVLRFVENHYKETQPATIGAFFLTKRLSIHYHGTVKLKLWDTAGHPQFARLTPTYYQDAHLILLCCDVTSPESLATVQKYVDQLASNYNLVLILCKMDLISHHDTTINHNSSNSNNINSNTNSVYRDAQLLCRRHGLQCLETSAKTGQGVQQAFTKMTTLLLQQTTSQNWPPPPEQAPNHYDTPATNNNNNTTAAATAISPSKTATATTTTTNSHPTTAPHTAADLSQDDIRLEQQASNKKQQQPSTTQRNRVDDLFLCDVGLCATNDHGRNCVIS